MEYIETMRSTCAEGFNRLFENIEVTDGLAFVDFPDYPNVGDSAIALGACKYFENFGLRVSSTMCIGTLHLPAIIDRRVVYINGGGNIAGFFGGIDRHRNNVAQLLPDRSLLLQGPQSIYWADADAEREFTDRFLTRSSLRIAVRDRMSFDKLVAKGAAPILMPDSVHMLGNISAQSPTQAFVVLARGDQESANDSRTRSFPDWLRDDRRVAIESRLRWKYRYLGKAGAGLNPTPSQWKTIAESRLARGVRMLSAGETVVTDRLHAMLIALQMGRSVIAVDNKNRKLSNYADTWFAEVKPPVTFAESIDAAVDLVAG